MENFLKKLEAARQSVAALELTLIVVAKLTEMLGVKPTNPTGHEFEFELENGIAAYVECNSNRITFQVWDNVKDDELVTYNGMESAFFDFKEFLKTL